MQRAVHSPASNGDMPADNCGDMAAAVHRQAAATQRRAAGAPTKPRASRRRWSVVCVLKLCHTQTVSDAERWQATAAIVLRVRQARVRGWRQEGAVEAIGRP